MSYWTLGDRLLNGVLFIWSISHYSSSFNVVELIAIVLAMTSIRSVESNNPLFLATFYIFTFNYIPDFILGLTFPLICGYQINDVLPIISDFILLNRIYLCYLIFLLIICTLIQLIAYKFARKNTCRKIFHFIAFLIFFNAPAPVFLVAHHLIYMFVLLMMTSTIPENFFSLFTSNRDLGEGVFSHLILLGGLTYSRRFLGDDEYIKMLISVCIMDSFASIVGKYFNNCRKSCTGFLVVR
ncbi:hypothetical protein PAEPH01_2621 [Pancytospora epiphaga]|nr:hypothetical protein PAEPH01_2621 [Pancytospora epiphaga]